MDEEFEEEKDDHERAINGEENWNENEVKGIQGKIFKENQFHKHKTSFTTHIFGV